MLRERPNGSKHYLVAELDGDELLYYIDHVDCPREEGGLYGILTSKYGPVPPHECYFQYEEDTMGLETLEPLPAIEGRWELSYVAERDVFGDLDAYMYFVDLSDDVPRREQPRREPFEPTKVTITDWEVVHE